MIEQLSKIQLKNNEWLHGSTTKFDMFNNRLPIKWFTKSYDYATEYAGWSSKDGYVYKVKLNVSNTFNCDITDSRVFKLSIGDYEFSDEMLDIINRLDISTQEMLKITNRIFKDDREKRKANIYSIIRHRLFAQLLILNEYDSVSTVEFGNKCIGVLNNNDIEILEVYSGNEKSLLEYYKNKYSLKESTIKHIISLDPTKNKKYSTWLLENYDNSYLDENIIMLLHISDINKVNINSMNSLFELEKSLEERGII